MMRLSIFSALGVAVLSLIQAACTGGTAVAPGGMGTSGSGSGGQGSGGTAPQGGSSGASSGGSAPVAGAPAGGAGGASACNPGTMPCPSGCVNTLTDFNNCGACGMACADGQSCVNGGCQCSSGFISCNGACVESNGLNCGTCGNVCAQGSLCSNGQCIVGGCAPNFTECTGACFDLTGHRLHCGSCTTACPAGQTCWMSECGCPQGTEACTGTTCQDVTMDENNCGTCGHVCPANSTCTGGICQCPEGQSECASTSSCEDLVNDEQNCGTCGTVCSGGEQCFFGGCVDPSSVNCGGGTHTNNKCTVGARNNRGPYYISNNLWNMDAGAGTQCIWDTCTDGDLVGWGTNWNWSGGNNEVKSYASLVFGWHWSDNTSLGVQISSNTNVNCGWQFTPTLNGGTDVLNVAYDLWVHTIANPNHMTSGANQPTDEIMVWLYRAGGAGPITSNGQPTATMSIGGGTWELYEGTTTLKVWSFVRTSNATTAVMNMMDFPRWLASNRGLSGSKYVSSVEAGTEIFSGEGQLETNGFYCRIQ